MRSTSSSISRTTKNTEDAENIDVHRKAKKLQLRRRSANGENCDYINFPHDALNSAAEEKFKSTDTNLKKKRRISSRISAEQEHSLVQNVTPVRRRASQHQKEKGQEGGRNNQRFLKKDEVGEGTANRSTEQREEFISAQDRLLNKASFAASSDQHTSSTEDSTSGDVRGLREEAAGCLLSIGRKELTSASLAIGDTVEKRIKTKLTCGGSSSHEKNQIFTAPKNSSKTSLFLSDSEDCEDEEDAGKNQVKAKNSFSISRDRIAVNKAYAQAYELRKRRELLKKNKDVLDEATSEESSHEKEDEEAELLTEKVETKILSTLAKIKNKDPSIYDQSNKFFDESDFEQEGGEDEQVRKKSVEKMRYSDVVRKALTEEGATAFIDEENATKAKKAEVNSASYHEEINALKKAFISAAENVSGEEDLFLQARKKTADEELEEEKNYKNFLSTRKGDPEDSSSVLKHYWAADDTLDADECFLRDYILTQAWREDRDPILSGGRVMQTIDEEEDEIKEEETDIFEATYNFRFEEEGGTEIKGHARQIEGSVRQKPDKRKRQREARKARHAEEKAQREEELKRLKNIKKQEILEKIRRIQEIAGHNHINAEAIDLDGDFDPEEHDKKMAHMLGEDYEELDEVVNADDLLKTPQGYEETLGTDDVANRSLEALTKKQKKLLQLRSKSARPLSAAGGDDDGAYAPLLEGGVTEDKSDKDCLRNDAENEDGECGEWWMCDSCGLGIPAGRKRFDCTTCENFTLCKRCFRNVRHEHQLIKRTIPRHCRPPKSLGTDSQEESKSVSNIFDVYFQVDYEDIIGDLPTRFKYTAVPSESYGMTAEEILTKSEKELNAKLSLKKLAPYRDRCSLTRRKVMRSQHFSRMKKKQKTHNGRASVQITGISGARLAAYSIG